MVFEPGISYKGIENTALLFTFYEGKLLVKDNGGLIGISTVSDLEMLNLKFGPRHYLGNLDSIPCYCTVLYNDSSSLTEIIPEGISFRQLRSLLGIVDDDTFRVAGLASQIINWDSTHRYCGRCATPMEIKEDERAKICPGCGFVSFPRISPAIITAVVRDSSILLARAHRFPPGLYSVLAGFVEPGENLEECLKREVREEVGIEVKNVHYFGSQPWPFPHSLMIAFTAEYAGGKINIDKKELSDAGWFSPSNFPEIPTKGTIARELIEWFFKKNR
ncbi:MAG: NAD(+) diphosphatase [Spirochaetota bacterium]|nr:MAG: NAD(+) diphosphatase [Spirochaetota bacterium]